MCILSMYLAFQDLWFPWHQLLISGISLYYAYKNKSGQRQNKQQKILAKFIYLRMEKETLNGLET